MRPYDAQADAAFSRTANQEIEAYTRAVDENAQGAEKAAESYNLLRVDVEEYAKSLKELQEQGLYFGDAGLRQGVHSMGKCQGRCKAVCK